MHIILNSNEPLFPPPDRPAALHNARVATRNRPSDHSRAETSPRLHAALQEPIHQAGRAKKRFDPKSILLLQVPSEPELQPRKHPRANPQEARHPANQEENRAQARQHLLPRELEPVQRRRAKKNCKRNRRQSGHVREVRREVKDRGQS